MSYLALYREWRPQKFSEIIGQEHISRTLQNAVRTNRIAHAYLFCGPRGTGKTTSAKVLAKTLNCLNPKDAEPCNECDNCRKVTDGTSMDVMEIDAASNRGIDEIRDLREKVRFAPTEGKYRIYIIDEVHMLTTEAFNALLKTLEEPPGHVVFVLATTEPHKIPMTVLSRCQRFDFRAIGISDIKDRLTTVVKESGVDAENEALEMISRAAEGGMRDALSILDQCISFGGKSVTVDVVNSVLGTVNTQFLFELIDTLINNNVADGLKLVDRIVRQGKDIRQFTKDVTYFLRNLLLIEVCRDAQDLILISKDQIEDMRQKASGLGKKRIMSLIELFTSTEREMKWTFQPRLILELAVIKASDKSGQSSYEQLEERIHRLEQLIAKGQPITGLKDNVKDTGIKAGNPAPKAKKAVPLKNDVLLKVDADSPVDVEMIKGCWQEIMQRIKKVRMSARAFLIEGSPVSVSDGRLILSFPAEYTFHKEKVEQPENREAIEQVLQEVTGSALKISCKFENELSGVSVSVNEQKGDSTVEDAIRLFGGDVVEVND